MRTSIAWAVLVSLMVSVGLVACGGGSSSGGDMTSQNTDVSGYWAISSQITQYMSLSQSSATISGSFICSNAPVHASAISGNASGNTISISFHDEGCENQLSGTVSGTAMSGTGTLTINPSLGSCSATPGTVPWSATKLASNPCPPNSGNAITTTIPVNALFSFSSGSIATTGGDMKYINTDIGTATSSLITSGVSGNYGNSYTDFTTYLSNANYLPSSDDWWNAETVYLNNGSFDARGKLTRWFKTTTNKYAIVFIVGADSNSITIQYVYPYGTFTY